MLININSSSSVYKYVIISMAHVWHSSIIWIFFEGSLCSRSSILIITCYRLKLHGIIFSHQIVFPSIIISLSNTRSSTINCIIDLSSRLISSIRHLTSPTILSICPRSRSMTFKLLQSITISKILFSFSDCFLILN